MPKEKATRESMMRAIRLDLLKNFGYDARIEMRKMPVWRIVVTDKEMVEKLKSKGGDPDSGTYQELNYNMINTNPARILSFLFASNQLGPTFLDETELDYNIDILLKCSFRDLESVKIELKKNGFDLIKGEKEMKVLVIRDPKPENNI